MELQAIRYAAMVANMTFEQTVQAHKEYLAGGALIRIRSRRFSSFGLDEPSEDDFGAEHAFCWCRRTSRGS